MLAEADALLSGMPLDELIARCRARQVLRTGAAARDVEGSRCCRIEDAGAFARYSRRSDPGVDGRGRGLGWRRGRFVPALPVAADDPAAAALAAMTAELVGYRLALSGRSEAQTGEGFVAVVEPMAAGARLRLPGRASAAAAAGAGGGAAGGWRGVAVRLQTEGGGEGAAGGRGRMTRADGAVARGGSG
ncbi:MAG: hypothetical protein R3F65_21845 [bacterium]